MQSFLVENNRTQKIDPIVFGPSVDGSQDSDCVFIVISIHLMHIIVTRSCQELCYLISFNLINNHEISSVLLYVLDGKLKAQRGCE